MKTTRLILLSFFVLSFLPLNAKKVSVEKAENLAISHLQSKGVMTRSSADLTLVHTQFIQLQNLRSSDANSEEAAYYVFNKENGQGFIIVSADDVVIPVLGYTDTGSYDSNSLPPNFAYWMESLSQEIAYAVENQIPQDAETKALWESYAGDNSSFITTRSSVAPLVQTNWHQYAPYNDLCPQGSVTGCTATAMAQIMKFHNHPAARSVTIPGYTTDINRYVIPSIPGTTYDWGAMTDTYSNSSSSREKEAVATLMYHCGASSLMDYTTIESGAYTSDAAIALCTYFQYDQSIQTRVRSFYSTAQWENILKTEVDAQRPVLYEAHGQSGGHSFVCDGYDDTGKFHFNWGWVNGAYNGYFATTALNPSSSAYNGHQEIVINIRPDEGGANAPELKKSKGLSIYNTKRPNSTMPPTADQGDTLCISATITNYGIFNFVGEIGIALIDRHTNQIITIFDQSSVNLGNWGSFKYDKKYCAIPISTPSGRNRIEIIYRQAGESLWSWVEGDPYQVIKYVIINSPVSYSTPFGSGADVTAIKELKQKAIDFEIYPNPASDILNIKAEGLEIKQIGIYNMTGSLISKYTLSDGTESISVKSIPKGTYILKVETSEGVHSHKFVKQ